MKKAIVAKADEVAEQVNARQPRRVLQTPMKKSIKAKADEVAEAKRTTRATRRTLATPVKKDIKAKADEVAEQVNARQPRRVLETPMKKNIKAKAEEVAAARPGPTTRRMATPVRRRLVEKADEMAEVRASRQPRAVLSTPIKQGIAEHYKTPETPKAYDDDSDFEWDAPSPVRLRDSARLATPVRRELVRRASAMDARRPPVPTSRLHTPVRQELVVRAVAFGKQRESRRERAMEPGLAAELVERAQQVSNTTAVGRLPSPSRLLRSPMKKAIVSRAAQLRDSRRIPAPQFDDESCAALDQVEEPVTTPSTSSPATSPSRSSAQAQAAAAAAAAPTVDVDAAIRVALADRWATLAPVVDELEGKFSGSVSKYKKDNMVQDVLAFVATLRETLACAADGGAEDEEAVEASTESPAPSSSPARSKIPAKRARPGDDEADGADEDDGTMDGDDSNDDDDDHSDGDDTTPARRSRRTRRTPTRLKTRDFRRKRRACAATTEE